MKINLDKINEIGKDYLSGNDYSFFQRVWASEMSIYSDRLKAISFSGKERVLDAGCGFGQWSVALSEMNNHVDSLDVSGARINTLKSIVDEFGINNVNPVLGSIDCLEFEDNSFDAIYCYSAIYFSDVKKTIKEFYRVLKEDGVLYISTNGLGWYLHNLIDGHNSDEHFDSKKMAVKTIKNSLEYYGNGVKLEGQLITPSNVIEPMLAKEGFKNIRIDSDGKLNDSDGEINPRSFYPKSYHNHEGVFEILTTK